MAGIRTFPDLQAYLDKTGAARRGLVGDLNGTWTTPALYLQAYVQNHPDRTAEAAAAAPIRRIWDEQVEATPNATCSHFVFSVPPDATASFSTPLVAMRWLLRFQFTAVGAGGAQQCEAGGGGGREDEAQRRTHDREAR